MMTREQEIAQYDGFFEEVAKALNANVKTKHYCKVITLENGIPFNVTIERGRFNVFGNYPQANDGTWFNTSTSGYDLPSRTFALNVTVKRFVTTIKNQFLPRYEKTYHEIQERVKSWNEFNDNIEKRKNELEKIPGIERFSDKQSARLHVSISTNNDDSIYGEIQVNQDSYRINLRSVPDTIAERIFEVLKNAND